MLYLKMSYIVDYYAVAILFGFHLVNILPNCHKHYIIIPESSDEV